ncbi:uncharacterized protein LOC144102721 [Amblyomma americanum]
MAPGGAAARWNEKRELRRATESPEEREERLAKERVTASQTIRVIGVVAPGVYGFIPAPNSDVWDYIRVYRKQNVFFLTTGYGKMELLVGDPGCDNYDIPSFTSNFAIQTIIGQI